MEWKAYLIVLLVAATAFFAFSRLSAKRYGALRLNRSVGEAFEMYAADDRLRYYISGPEACPNVVMGLDRSWTLEESLWKEQALTAETLKTLVTAMSERRAPLHGFDIFDHRGLKIGVWFSAIDIFTTITILDNNRAIIAAPPSGTAETAV